VPKNKRFILKQLKKGRLQLLHLGKHNKDEQRAYKVIGNLIK